MGETLGKNTPGCDKGFGDPRHVRTHLPHTTHYNIWQQSLIVVMSNPCSVLAAVRVSFTKRADKDCPVARTKIRKMAKTSFESVVKYLSILDDKYFLVHIVDEEVPVKFLSRDGEEMIGKTDKFRLPINVLLGVLVQQDERFALFYTERANTLTREVKVELLSRLVKGAKVTVCVEHKVAGEVYTKYGVELTISTDIDLVSVESIRVINPDANSFLDRFKPVEDKDFFDSLL